MLYSARRSAARLIPAEKNQLEGKCTYQSVIATLQYYDNGDDSLCQPTCGPCCNAGPTWLPIFSMDPRGLADIRSHASLWYRHVGGKLEDLLLGLPNLQELYGLRDLEAFDRLHDLQTPEETAQVAVSPINAEGASPGAVLSFIMVFKNSLTNGD